MAEGYLSLLATQLGTPLWFLITIIIWSAIWKLTALWKSARRNHLVWFIVLAIINTVGILEILYIYVFSKMGKQNKEVAKRPARRKRR